jgi:hypothetical protein
MEEIWHDCTLNRVCLCADRARLTRFCELETAEARSTRKNYLALSDVANFAGWVAIYKSVAISTTRTTNERCSAS